MQAPQRQKEALDSQVKFIYFHYIHYSDFKKTNLEQNWERRRQEIRGSTQCGVKRKTAKSGHEHLRSRAASVDLVAGPSQKLQGQHQRVD